MLQIKQTISLSPEPWSYSYIFCNFTTLMQVFGECDATKRESETHETDELRIVAINNSLLIIHLFKKFINICLNKCGKHV